MIRVTSKSLAWCLRPLTAFALLWAFAAVVPARAAAWDIRKLHGEDYVSVDNVRQFYRFDKLTRSGRHLTLTSPKVIVTMTVGSAECLMNRVKFVFSRPVEEIGSRPFVSRLDLQKLIDPVLRPSFIKNAGSFTTVILDPGHGGKDPGATNPFGTEANFNLRVANLLRAELMNPTTPGVPRFKVLMTRTSDRFLSLQERVNLANSVRDNAIFISLHFNSGGAAAHGIETFTLSPPGVAHFGRGVVPADALQRVGNQHDSANVALATATHGMVLRGLGPQTFDRGIKRARFTVISGVRHPAILLEGGFMSNPTEARLIAKPEYQAALAKAVAVAVRKYRLALNNPVKGPATR
jgi:N-acetylmuramoyl-L-alanine amidase